MGKGYYHSTDFEALDLLLDTLSTLVPRSVDQLELKIAVIISTTLNT